MIFSERQAAETVRSVYLKNSGNAHEAIESCLKDLLAEHPEAEKQEALQAIAEQFRTSELPDEFLASETGNELLRFVSLLLGKSVSASDITQTQLQERLVRSLQGVFSSLNQLLRAMGSTLSQGDRFDVTIRSLLQEELVAHDERQPLEASIDRIRQSFFATYESSKTAHKQILEKILEELNPENMLARTSGGLKLGPLHKAAAFDNYLSIYRDLRVWHESGRAIEDYLRVFEKNCSEMPWEHKNGGV